jgi:hypothetical protein
MKRAMKRLTGFKIAYLHFRGQSCPTCCVLFRLSVNVGIHSISRVTFWIHRPLNGSYELVSQRCGGTTVVMTTGTKTALTKGERKARALLSFRDVLVEGPRT